MAFTEEKIKKALEQLEKESTIVDYDTKEYPVEVIVQKYKENLDDDENELFIPDYQRDFVWTLKRQSKFVESILLGLPIPYIFVADNAGRIEVIDGSQRIRTLFQFTSNLFKLVGLEKLTEFNDFQFKDFPLQEQRRFNRKTLRMIELTEKANEDVRRDIFERINTGSDELNEMEKRKGILIGPFYNVLKSCASNPIFKQLCPISEAKSRREEGAELVLRFFAYSENYTTFAHSVTDFLTDYMKKKNSESDHTLLEKQFTDMIEYANKILKYGFKRSPTATVTPRVRFEALSVGINLALQEKPNLPTELDMSWMDSKEFSELTRSDASNSKPKVAARIEYVKNKLLGA